MALSACLICNPVAGKGTSEQELQKIRQLLSPYMRLNIFLTSPETEADQLAQTAVESGADLVLAAGGDGTVSATASALVKTSVPLGVISRGTANAFANALGIPTDLEAACQVIAAGHTRQIDAACCNNSTVVLLAGMGLGARALQQADRETKTRLGALAYVVAGLDQLQDIELFSAELEVDEDRKIEVSAAAITVANVAPATSILAQGPAGVIPDDGLLDLTIVAPESTLEAVAATYNLLRSAIKGEGATQRSIGYLRAQQIKITTQPSQAVMVDGELNEQTPIDMKCLPAALTVYTPQSKEEVSAQPHERLSNLPSLKISSC